MVNNYNHIAAYYDVMAKIISFNQISKSQTFFLPQLIQSRHCLIVGGGTAHYLNDLLKANKHLKVTYLDTSSRMTLIAKQSIEPRQLERVSFLNEESQLNGKFDALILFYFLDLFDEPTITKQLIKYDHLLEKGSKVLVSDFLPKQSFWSQLYHQCILLFINTTTNGKIKRFLDYQAIITKMDRWVKTQSQSFGNHFFSVIYEKKG